MRRVALSSHHQLPIQHSDSRFAEPTLTNGMTFNMTVSHIFLDANGTLIFPNPNFTDYCITLLQNKGVPTNKLASKLAEAEADKILQTHKRNSPQISCFAHSERMTLAHYFGTLLENLSASSEIYPWLDWGYAMYDDYNPSNKWESYADVHETLEMLKQKGYSLTVISDFGPGLSQILEATGLSVFFDNIFVSTVIGASKASSEIYRKALELLRISHESVIMVCD